MDVGVVEYVVWCDVVVEEGIGGGVLMEWVVFFDFEGDDGVEGLGDVEVFDELSGVEEVVVDVDCEEVVGVLGGGGYGFGVGEGGCYGFFIEDGVIVFEGEDGLGSVKFGWGVDDDDGVGGEWGVFEFCEVEGFWEMLVDGGVVGVVGIVEGGDVDDVGFF